MQRSTLDVLDAYRADLSNANKSELSAGDSTWLAFGMLLQRAVGMRSGERLAYLAEGATAIARESPGDRTAQAIGLLGRPMRREDDAREAICTASMLVANDAEDAGAFALATAMLDASRSLVGLSEFRLQGRLIAQQARILRKIGELDVAMELCDEVADMGVTHGDRELLGLSHLGKGVIARIRGNYPRARTEFLAVLDAADAMDGLEELRLHAHHGLLVVAAVAQDFDTALKHGALALEAARQDEQRIEVLQNLANVCYDVGQFRSALHGYLQALTETRVLRVRMAALGGAAVAAARLGEAQMVRTLADAATPLLAQRGHEYELADMSREFSEAYSFLREAELFDRYRDAAMERARRGGFFEIVHRLESFRPQSSAPRPSDVALTQDALAIARHLASGDSQELLLAAVSSGHQGWYTH